MKPPRPKQLGNILLGLAGVAGLILFLQLLPDQSNDAVVESRARSSESANVPGKVIGAPTELSAVAGCKDGRVVVQNLMAEPWIQAKIVVNRIWEFTADGIPPGTTIRYLPSIFTKSGSERLNLEYVTCKNIDIHATVNGKRLHWNGGY